MGKKKVISVEQSTHQRLMDRGKKGETFDQVINRVMESEITQTKQIMKLEIDIENLNDVVAQDIMSKED